MQLNVSMRLYSSPCQHYPEVTVEDLLRFGASPEFKFPFEPGSPQGLHRMCCTLHGCFQVVVTMFYSFCGPHFGDRLPAHTEIAPFPVMEEPSATPPRTSSAVAGTAAASADTSSSGI